MNVLIIIKDGLLYNQTLSTIKFNNYGESLDYNFIKVNTWEEGFIKAISLKYEYGLFVDSGTVFVDIHTFIEQIKNYPHQGLIGHIIDSLDHKKYFSLDQQCFFLKLNYFDVDDFRIANFTASIPERSENNLHDNYTPLWIKSKEKVEQHWVGSAFGERLLSKQLTNNRIAVNWNNNFRKDKKFLYNDTDRQDWESSQQSYLDLAEKQLWVFNNETVPIATESTLVTPASGLCWIKNIISLTTMQVDLVDISNIQLRLASDLWTNWDGNNYGEFVSNFMTKNKVIHFNLDEPTMSDLDRLKLKNTKHFISTVNTRFIKQMSNDNFVDLWQQAKQTKQVTFNHCDIVKFLPEYVQNVNTNFNLWVSNILEYKYTMIKNTKQDYDRFTLSLNNAKVLKIYG